jgi:Putative restriction endonuclease
MTTTIASPIHYPSGDGQPVAETFDRFKKTLYAQIGIPEYWQFDPKGEWIKEKLRGFQLVNGEYVPIANGRSQALGLQLEVDGTLISFYRLDNGEKLLIPIELYERAEQLQAKARQLEAQLMVERSQAQAQIDELQQQLDRYRERFGE